MQHIEWLFSNIIFCVIVIHIGQCQYVRTPYDVHRWKKELISSTLIATEYRIL